MHQRRITALTGFILAITLLLPGLAQAHRFWLLPSATVLSGEGAWITVDAARSNDIFYFNHTGLDLDGLRVRTPDGGAGHPSNRHNGKLRSSFDLKIDRQGTYKIALVEGGLFASYQAGGERHRRHGSADALEDGIPDDARDVRVMEVASRAETFVTAGAPTRDVFEPTGHGLELVPKTHPNDLYAGESAQFRLLLDGQPAQAVDVTVIPGGTRYRDAPNTIERTTDAQGRFELTWPRAGMYWLEASVADDKTTVKAAGQRRVTYVATLEVLPL